MRALTTNDNQRQTLISIDELAAYLGKPKATLYAWRSRGLGPKAIRMGRDLRYRMEEVERWLDSQTEEYVGEHERTDTAEPERTTKPSEPKAG